MTHDDAVNRVFETVTSCDPKHIIDGLELDRTGTGNVGGCACDKCVTFALQMIKRKLMRCGLLIMEKP